MNATWRRVITVILVFLGGAFGGDKLISAVDEALKAGNAVQESTTN